jgi:hypothetical protein
MSDSISSSISSSSSNCIAPILDITTATMIIIISSNGNSRVMPPYMSQVTCPVHPCRRDVRSPACLLHALPMVAMQLFHRRVVCPWTSVARLREQGLFPVLILPL